MTFVNRTRERQEITSIIRKFDGNNVAIVLSGTTGIGKSGLAQFLLKNEICFRKSICVHVSKSSPDSIENSHYVNAIYREFCEYANSNKLSAMSPLKYAITKPTNLLRLAKDWLKNRVGLPEGSKLYEQSSYETSLLQKKDYIIAILKTDSFVINIDNIQNIDIVSLEILFEIIKAVTNTVLIFEYTTDSENQENLMTFINELKSVCYNSFAYSIKQLPFTEAKRLMPENVQVDEDILSKIYTRNNGNLMQIILANQLIDEQRNSIQSALSNLNKNEKYIVYLVYWSGGRIQLNQLTMMLTYSYSDGAYILLPHQLQSIIDSLLSKNVISFSEQYQYEIKHDSIIEELEHTSLNPQLLIAYNVVKNYLLEQLNASTNNSSLVDILFSLFIKQGDEDLITIFPQISKIIYGSKYPQTAISKLMFYQSQLKAQGVTGLQTSKIIYEQLAAICNDLGLSEFAQDMLEHIYNPEDPYHVALQASIYGGQCNCEAIDTIIENHSGKNRLNLIIRLCKLTAAMMSLPRKTSLEIVSSLLADYENSNYLEYAYLLRNSAELVDDAYEAISIYERCIEIFNRYDKKILVAEIHLSLAMIYTYIDELNEARAQLVTANEMSEFINESCLLNNHAVIDILSGRTDDEVQKKLSDALLINGGDYERLIIMCNLLVCYTTTGKDEQARELCLRIENTNYQKFQYDEFLHIIYTNLLYYYKSKEDIYHITLYSELLKDILNRQNVSKFIVELTNSLLYGIHSEQFYSKFPYRVDFLGYWVFRIDPNLRNC